MYIFLRRLVGLPVPFRDIFGDHTLVGQALEGDPFAPPTTIEGWPAWVNAIRSGILASWFWDTYSVLDTGSVEPKYLVFGDGNVMPSPVLKRFIAVKHGREDCRFAIFDPKKGEAPFIVVARGSREEVVNTVLNLVKGMPTEELLKLFVREISDLSHSVGGLTPEECEHEARQFVGRAVNSLGDDVIAFL